MRLGSEFGIGNTRKTMRDNAGPLCFIVLGAPEADFQHRTVGPVCGGVDIAIPKEIQGFMTWE